MGIDHHGKGRRTYFNRPFRNNPLGKLVHEAIDGKFNIPDDLSDIKFIDAIEKFRSGRQRESQWIIDHIVGENPGYNPFQRGLLTKVVPAGVIKGPEFDYGRNIVNSTSEDVLSKIERIYSNRNPKYGREKIRELRTFKNRIIADKNQ